MVLMRTDPFRELDRLTQQVFGTAARPAFMPMDAWRDGGYSIEFDLPGVQADSIDLDVERNVLTVRLSGQRKSCPGSRSPSGAAGSVQSPADSRGQPRP